MNSVSASTLGTVAESGTIDQQLLWADQHRQNKKLAKQALAQEEGVNRLQLQRNLANRSLIQGQENQRLQQEEDMAAFAEDEAEENYLSDQIRQQQQAERKSLKKSKIKTAYRAMVSPFRKTTSAALRQYWWNILKSYGATLILINAHVFCRFVFGESLFCKLGHEWVENKKLIAAKTTVGQKANKFLEAAGDSIGILEAMLLILIDFIVLALLLLAFVQFIIIFAAPIILGIALYNLF